MKTFSDWRDKNGLLLSTSKTKEMVVDFHIHGVNIEVVQTYKYLGLNLDKSTNHVSMMVPPTQATWTIQ